MGLLQGSDHNDRARIMVSRRGVRLWLSGVEALEIERLKSEQEQLVSKATRATAALEKAGVAFTVHSYDYDPDAERSACRPPRLRRGPRARAENADGPGRWQAGLRHRPVRSRSVDEEARRGRSAGNRHR